MRLKLVGGVLGAFLTFLGLIMVTPAIFSWHYGEESLTGILLAAGLTVLVGAAAWWFLGVGRREITTREGLGIVAGAWLLACLFGALPFWFCGVFKSFSDCYFETCSGFTTTGATVLTSIEHLDRGLLFWRSLTHWLGGMGIIVLSVAILPLIGVGGMQLFRAEVPGPVADKIKPRIAETARTLWLIYILLSLAETGLLALCGMDLHESLCHTFATMATGGFSTRNLSIESYETLAGYSAVAIQWVITLFMFLAGINFALHFAALRRGLKGYWKDTEFRVYLVVVVAAILLCTIMLRTTGTYGTVEESLRKGAFQVNTIISTTGFTTANYETWPFGLQMLLLLLMFLGGCTGSTGGGIKVMRVWLMLKHAYNELYLLIHPRAVKPLTYGHSTLSPQVMRSIWSFFLLFIGLFFASSLLLALLGQDPLSAMSATVACLGNIGPALGTVGPHENYAHLCLPAKWILVLCMLLGRLEVYTIIILFVPAFWRK